MITKIPNVLKFLFIYTIIWIGINSIFYFYIDPEYMKVIDFIALAGLVLLLILINFKQNSNLSKWIRKNSISVNNSISTYNNEIGDNYAETLVKCISNNISIHYLLKLDKVSVVKFSGTDMVMEVQPGYYNVKRFYQNNNMKLVLKDDTYKSDKIIYAYMPYNTEFMTLFNIKPNQ